MKNWSLGQQLERINKEIINNETDMYQKKYIIKVIGCILQLTIMDYTSQ